MPPVGFEEAKSESELPQTHSLHRSATGTNIAASLWTNHSILAFEKQKADY